MQLKLLLAASVVLAVFWLSHRQAVAPPAYREVGMKVCNPDGSEAGVITEVGWKDNQSVYYLNIPGLTVENFNQGAKRARWVPVVAPVPPAWVVQIGESCYSARRARLRKSARLLATSSTSPPSCQCRLTGDGAVASA